MIIKPASDTPLSALKFVEIPFSATEAALVQGRIDAALMVEPMLSTAKTSSRISRPPPDHRGVMMLSKIPRLWTMRQ